MTGGTTAEAGSSGEGGEGAGGIAIEAVTTSPLCSNRDVEVTFTVDGGRAPYDWTADFDAFEFSLVPHGATATLRGAPPAAGDYAVTVRVSDAEQRLDEREVTLSVKSTPVILTRKIPSVCADEVYSAELNAEGGDVSKYRWSSSLPSETGLGVVGNRIEGRFGSWPAGEISTPFTLNLESEGCAAEPLEVKLEAAYRAECPLIGVEGGVPTLPPPCAGSAYAARLQAVGGDDRNGYTWRALDAPGDLAIDAHTGMLSGIVNQAGTLKVEVEDGAGRKIAASYGLEPRTRCWLAYLAEEDGPTRLHLFDALLGNRHDFSARAPGAAVADFRFSPDGRFLAYRAGVTPGGLELTLVELATMRQQVVGFEDVRHYAWSDDGSALAVAYVSGGSPVVGGLRVQASGEAQPELYSEFRPAAADAKSELVWFGSSQLAFLISTGNPFPYPALANLGEHGFSGTHQYSDSFPLRTRLHPAPLGFFAIPEDEVAITFYAADASPGKVHADVLVAPTGRYTALVHGGRLQVFRASDESSLYPEDVAPYRTAAGCDELLAWAQSRDRVACLRAAGGQAGVNLFELDSQTAELSGPFPMRMGSHAPQVTELTFQRRIFSPSARRFAFTTNDRLYVAKIAVTDSVVDVAFASVGADAPNGVLAFSPDERMLLAHRGTRLGLFRFENLVQESLLTSRVSVAPACSESGKAAKGQYCGDVNERAAFAWSPDSALIAIATPPAELTVVDVRFLDYGHSSVAATTHCSGDCVARDHFAFQP